MTFWDANKPMLPGLPNNRDERVVFDQDFLVEDRRKGCALLFLCRLVVEAGNPQFSLLLPDYADLLIVGICMIAAGRTEEGGRSIFIALATCTAIFALTTAALENLPADGHCIAGTGRCYMSSFRTPHGLLTYRRPFRARDLSQVIPLSPPTHP
jgi:hypothetical protein